MCEIRVVGEATGLKGNMEHQEFDVKATRFGTCLGGAAWNRVQEASKHKAFDRVVTRNEVTTVSQSTLLAHLKERDLCALMGPMRGSAGFFVIILRGRNP